MVDKHEWLEDELYGRYELRLRFDFGRAELASRALSKIKELLSELDALGHDAEIVYIVAADRARGGKR